VDESASATVFLVSDESSFLTGIDLPVDGAPFPGNPPNALFRWIDTPRPTFRLGCRENDDHYLKATE